MWWCIQTMKYYSALKRNELSTHEKTWRNLKCISEWKKPVWKGYTWYNSNNMTLGKRQNHGDIKMPVVARVGFLGGGRTGGAQRIFRAVKILCMTLWWWMHVSPNPHSSKPTEYTTPRVNPEVNYGRRVATTCLCQFISYNRCTCYISCNRFHRWGCW